MRWHAGLHSVPDVSRPPYRIVQPQRIKVVPDDHRDRRTGCAALSIMEVLLQTILSVDTPPLAPFWIVVLSHLVATGTFFSAACYPSGFRPKIKVPGRGPLLV
jgi:hypothetical protein